VFGIIYDKIAAVSLSAGLPRDWNAASIKMVILSAVWLYLWMGPKSSPKRWIYLLVACSLTIIAFFVPHNF
jgi:hypothetical protein